ncbi:MAG: ABC transporter ATP-binding protein [Deltaproteobacteria bacterium]|nr:ABC transporter ATP-binding protein [Deltaproteobacteria bacterium]
MSLETSESGALEPTVGSPVSPDLESEKARREGSSFQKAHEGQGIVFENVSRFYGEVLGVNRINLRIEPGITGLVGPNGSGKSTLMNLLTGLLRPTRGTLKVLGLTLDQPQELFRHIGYCSQFDSFPKGLTGYEFIYSFLRIHGFAHGPAQTMTWDALGKVSLEDAAQRKVAGYSKGMRQRIKLAQAISHQPTVLVLDEPLNGLDPMARAEIISLFKEFREEGKFLIISSHILHEVDVISDRVVLLNSGYVVAEGEIHGVRDEMEEHPMQVLIRCDRPAELAAEIFRFEYVAGAQIHQDRQGVLVSTREPARFFLALNDLVVSKGLLMDSVRPADDDVHALYEYLIEGEGRSS